MFILLRSSVSNRAIWIFFYRFLIEMGSNREAQVIDLEGDDEAVDQLLIFVNSKCSFLMDGKVSKLLIEYRKLELLLLAAKNCPHFTHSQLERLVEHEWSFMYEDERQTLLEQIKFDAQQIQIEINRQNSILNSEVQ